MASKGRKTWRGGPRETGGADPSAPGYRSNNGKRRFLDSVAATAGCTDCGMLDVRALEFDHARGVKLGCLSQMSSWAKLQAELAKCDVVCGSCHKIRTWVRAHG